MLPIFDEFRGFLENKCGLKLPKDKCWFDNLIIKGFTADGKIHKLFRIKIDNDLKVTYFKPDNYEYVNNVNLITFNELVSLKKRRLDYLEYESFVFLEDKLKKFQNYEPIVPVSTGKDSMVALYLTRLVNDNVRAIFNNTSLDVADSYIMAKNISNCEIMNPDEGFYPWLDRTKMFPTRFRRACCSIFKSGVMLNKLDKKKKYLLVMGMRNEESDKRSCYEDEWKNVEWGNVNWQGILPIRKWTELDVWLYVLYKDIPINNKYKKGYRRVGCGIACPFYNKSTWVLDDYWYPYLRKRWVGKLTENFIEEGKATILNCTIKEYIEGGWNGGIVRDKPTQEVISEFMEYKNITDENIARKYFNNICSVCKSKLKKDEVALSIKFHGNNTDVFFCKECFMKEYSYTKDKVEWYINRFKDEGCCLF